MNASRLLGSRLTTATGAAGGKTPPMSSHTPAQPCPSRHQEVYTSPVSPQMSTSSALIAVGLTNSGRLRLTAVTCVVIIVTPRCWNSEQFAVADADRNAKNPIEPA